MDRRLTQRDGQYGEHAGAYAPDLILYEDGEFAILSVGSMGGSHQINLSAEQMRELSVALGTLADEMAVG